MKETTVSYNRRQKIERKRFDKIAQEKIRLSSLDHSTHLGERKSKDTKVPWEGDIPFNKGHKLP